MRIDLVLTKLPTIAPRQSVPRTTSFRSLVLQNRDNKYFLTESNLVIASRWSEGRQGYVSHHQLKQGWFLQKQSRFWPVVLDGALAPPLIARLT